MPTPITTVRIPNDLRAALRKEARRRQTTRSEVIRAALREYLKAKPSTDTRPRQAA